MVDDSFSTRLRHWLQKNDLIADPFALSEADQERKILPTLFVDRPYLYDILGGLDQLRPAYLFARRGEGKTATREMVAYECEQLILKDKVLAVRYYDFSYLIELAGHDSQNITARHHAQAMTRACLKTLIDDVPAPYFDQLQTEERKLLATYAKQFADPLTAIQLIKLVGNETLDLSLEKMSALEVLAYLVKLIKQLGSSQENHYEAVFILIDRVDETELGPDAAIGILKPLVIFSLSLASLGISVKSFLPLEVGEELQKHVELRDDRVTIRQIEWDAEALKRLVNQRIHYYSEGNKTAFEELCESIIRKKVMKKLIDACDFSPRKLIQLCERMIHLHVSRSRETLLENEDLLDATAEVMHQKELDSVLPVNAVTPTGVAGEMMRKSGLYLDDGGHVWVDGVPIDPPLSELEFQLLKILYKKAPNIVPTNSILEVIYPGGLGGDDQNLRKLIGRLRKDLEPEKTGVESRFIRNSKGRGYFLIPDA
jgi:hypothetical protein